jgi:two-component system chemotaxis response regulator CheB
VAGHDIIVVGASMGGVEALKRLVSTLPPDLPAAVFIVCHFPTDGTSVLPQILSRHGALPAAHARDGEPITPGRVYVAPPNHHMLLQPGSVRLTHGPRENRHRPAIDPLFRSAARAYGPRVVGVVLTGALYDGTAGLLAIRSAGGVAVVQDPEEALSPAMPQSAQQIAGADHVLPLDRMGTVLGALARQPAATEGGSTMQPTEKIPEVIREDFDKQARGARNGHVSIFSCPECGGALWQVNQEDLIRFRCHVGHIYYGESLLAEQSEALEAALWTAVRTFKEQAVLARQLAAAAQQRSDSAAAARFQEEAQLAGRYGELIQSIVLKGPINSATTPEGTADLAPAAPARRKPDSPT